MDNPINFRDDKREISCRTINTIIKYVQEQGKDLENLLEGLPYDEVYLTDTNNWVSRELTEEIFQRLRVMFDDDEILYKVALASERLRTLGFLDYVTRLMSDPNFIIKQAPALNKYFNKTDEIQIVKFSPSGATVRYSAKPEYTLTLSDCYYTKGILAVIPNIWEVGPAKIWEETCSIAINKKGRIKGKFYTIDDQGYVSEHDAIQAKSGRDTPKTIGRLNSDGTFKLGNTVYGAKYCVYHISWSVMKMFAKKILYEFFTKPKVLMETIEEMLRENDLIQLKCEELYQKQVELQKHYVDTINALIRALDAKDHYTEDHSLKVTQIAKAIARELELPSNKINTIITACKLHDLGKIGIRESLLLKPGKLTDEEWEEIKRHPVLGAEIIKPLTFLSDVAVLIRQDHERWDGKGYPDGLKGKEIDIGSRVIIVADAYDAITSGRPYKKALSKDEAIEEIKRNSGTQFDPEVIEAFLKVMSKPS